jgi:hypothetical protein
MTPWNIAKKTLGPLVMVVSFAGAAAAQNARLRPASAEIETFVRAALEDQLNEKGFLRASSFDPSRPIAIRSDLPAAGLRLGPGALPRHERYKFRLVTVSEAQAEADRTHQPFHYIEVDGPKIDGDTGALALGTDLILPSDSKVGKLCCCNTVAYFRLVDGRWTFVKLDATACS